MDLEMHQWPKKASDLELRISLKSAKVERVQRLLPKSHGGRRSVQNRRYFGCPHCVVLSVGRLLDQRWYKSGTDKERAKYGFDQASNRQWRQNIVAGTGQDEYYTYDGLYQIKTLDRGTLTGTYPNFTGISGTPSWEEDWNYDATGNWHGSSSAYLTKVSGSTTLNQNRTHNVANEITAISTTTGTAWTTPVQDANGNLTQFPQPLSLGSGYTLKYDAWNRLVEVKPTGGSVLSTYAYDGANRRTTKVYSSTTRHYYYSDQWQVLEERVGTSSSADRQFVWGTRYIDDLIYREYSSTRYYALHDYFNVTAIVDTSGNVLERYGYDGFGTVRFMNATFGSASSSYSWETLYGAYRYDSDTGLYQVRNRYLHAKLGRWEKRDPIREMGGLNLYGLVENNPVNHADPLGYGKFDYLYPGKCCNNSSSKEYYLKDGEWFELAPGACTGAFTDCDGLTCSGKFYYVRGFETGGCDKGCVRTPHNWNEYCDKPCWDDRAWSPSGHGDNAIPPGRCEGSGGRGAPNCEPPNGYKWL